MPSIGDYELHVIHAGNFALDGGAMFGIVPKALWSRRITPDSNNRIPLSMRCLLLVGNGRVVLIDNGHGDKYDVKFAQIYGIDDEELNVEASLNAAGFSRADVTDVILTHLHFDHAGGNTVVSGDRHVPAFPNATYHVQKRHLAWARASNPREKASFFPENFEPIEAAGQLREVDGEVEILPGLHALLVDGHTEAQQMILAKGDTRSLVFVADLLPTIHHLAPAWGMGYDIRPLVTIDEKQRFLERAAREKWTLFFEHDREVEVADVQHGDRGYQVDSPRHLAEL